MFIYGVSIYDLTVSHSLVILKCFSRFGTVSPRPLPIPQTTRYFLIWLLHCYIFITRLNELSSSVINIKLYDEINCPSDSIITSIDLFTAEHWFFFKGWSIILKLYMVSALTVFFLTASLKGAYNVYFKNYKFSTV